MMGTQDSDLSSFFEDEHDDTGTISPSTDNLFSNRDVLERRLKCRLDREDLVMRGILPANHAAPNILAQIHQLERAKTGDILQRKIRVRSSRQQLVQRHILADSKVDASLQGKQTSLERHRIADSLNEQLFNRPGPLELIRENILKVEPNFADAIKHGCVPFHPTCKDVSTSPVYNANNGSPLSEVDASGCSLESLSPLAQDSMDTFSQAFSKHVNVDNFSGCSTDAFSLGNNVSSAVSELEECINSTADVFSRDIGKFDRSKEAVIRKQVKSNKKKLQNQNKQKVKKYKYHEYKPPGAVPATYQAPLDDRYKRLLEQQQMFLQLQVMKQNALVAAISGNGENSMDNQMEMEDNPTEQGITKASTPMSTQALGKDSALDDLRVIELRSALRVRGLPVSGSKAKLLERLKSYEDKRRIDCREISTQNLAPSAHISTCAANESSELLTKTVTPNRCANAFIKVTTYAAQNGETFQLVQAVPNMPTSEIQYQLIPNSVVLGSAHSAIQSFPVQSLAGQPLPPSSHVFEVPVSSQQVDRNLLSTTVSSSVTQNRVNNLPHISGHPVTQSFCQTRKPSQNIQVQFSQPTVSSLAGSSNLDALSGLGQSGSTAVDTLALQMLSKQIQEVVKSQVSIQTQTSCDVKESENGNTSSLFDKLQQLKQPNVTDTNFEKFEMLRNSTESLPTDPGQRCNPNTYQWSVRNSLLGEDNLDTKANVFSDLEATFRSRSQTDPLRNQHSNTSHNSANSYSPMTGSLPSTESLQIFNTNGTLISKTNGKDLRTLSLPSGISGVSMKIDSRACDDLMDILGELSNSASSSDAPIATHETPSQLILDNPTRFQNNVEKEMRMKESHSSLASLQTKTLSPSTISCHRQYGSFPGDLNLLGGTLHNSTISNHISPRNGSNRSSFVTSNSHELPSNQIHIGDVEMDSDTPYYSHENELEWLNLDTLHNMNSVADRPSEKNSCGSDGSKSLENRDSVQMDVLSTNLFENTKSHDALSIFDLECTQSLMMVDSTESEKWDL